MPRKSNTRSAQGNGSIRQRPDGRWEGRFTYTDDLGQKKRASVYADTQKECRQKLTATLKSVDEGSYTKTQRYTVSQWPDEWLSTYCKDLKPASLSGYRAKIDGRIKPYIGNSTLSALSNVQIQKYYNRLQTGDKEHAPLSPKSIMLIHGILHKALDQAVSARIIHNNPADHIKLPKVKRPDLAPIMDDNVSRFLEAIKGDRFERLFIVDLFSGLRQSEIIGLRWADVDLTPACSRSAVKFKSHIVIADMYSSMKRKMGRSVLSRLLQALSGYCGPKGRNRQNGNLQRVRRGTIPLIWFSLMNLVDT